MKLVVVTSVELRRSRVHDGCVVVVKPVVVFGRGQEVVPKLAGGCCGCGCACCAAVVVVAVVLLVVGVVVC